MTVPALRPVEWNDGLALIDQRLLPGELRWVRCATVEEAAAATHVSELLEVRDLRVGFTTDAGIAS